MSNLLGAITLSLIAGLVLRFNPRAAFTDAELCLQPIAAFGPALAVAVLIVADASFRSYSSGHLRIRRHGLGS